MGFRFQKRVKIFKWLTLNFSKTGTSVSIGGPGASININDGKVTGTGSIPGTGISYREELGDLNQPVELPKTGVPGWVWLVVVVLMVSAWLLV